MIASTPYLLRAIGDALRDEVLPALESAAMPAANLRGCLMLLAYVEDRVTNEGAVLAENNRDLRTLLKELGSQADLIGPGDLRRRIETILKRYPDREPLVGVQELAKENEEYEELLTELLRQTHERSDGLGAEKHKDLRRRLQARLVAIDDREYSLVERAKTFTPI